MPNTEGSSRVQVAQDVRGIHLTIPDVCWEPIGYAGTGEPDHVRLLCTLGLHINGTPHHLEAALVEPESALQRLADPALEREVMTGLQHISEGCYHTTTIRGREYVVYAFPYGA
jgi:hypothetical protein